MGGRVWGCARVRAHVPLGLCPSYSVSRLELLLIRECFPTTQQPPCQSSKVQLSVLGFSFLRFLSRLALPPHLWKDHSTAQRALATQEPQVLSFHSGPH